MPSWRRGGVATQRPAKPSTPVRFRSSPLKVPVNQHFSAEPLRRRSSTLPNSRLHGSDFCGHLQGFCPATDARNLGIRQKAVEGSMGRTDHCAGGEQRNGTLNLDLVRGEDLGEAHVEVFEAVVESRMPRSSTGCSTSMLMGSPMPASSEPSTSLAPMAISDALRRSGPGATVSADPRHPCSRARATSRTRAGSPATPRR